MPEVKPFRGLRFNSATAGEPGNLITPPYDVISPIEREKLAERSPYNMVHVILPLDADGQDRYQVARAHFSDWIEKGVLKQEETESYYLLRQTFADLSGAPRVRISFFAVVKLPEAGERSVLGHERTFAKPVEDRLRLTEATEANLGPVFLLYQDPGQKLAAFLGQMKSRPADISARTIDGTLQELWRVDADPAVAELLKEQTLYIADGHHRFRTAVTYRDQMREKEGANGLKPYDFVLAGLVSFGDPGLQIWPPHRLVNPPEGFDPEDFLTELEQWFEVTLVEDNLAERVAARSGGCALGVCIHGVGNYLLVLRDVDRKDLLGEDRGQAWRDLDMAVLHRGILERMLGIPEEALLEYEKNVEHAIRSAQNGAFTLAFILRTIKPEQIRDCAEANEPMPQKSTYFYPKLPTGAVINLLK